MKLWDRVSGSVSADSLTLDTRILQNYLDMLILDFTGGRNLFKLIENKYYVNQHNSKRDAIFLNIYTPSFDPLKHVEMETAFKEVYDQSDRIAIGEKSPQYINGNSNGDPSRLYSCMVVWWYGCMVVWLC